MNTKSEIPEGFLAESGVLQLIKSERYKKVPKEEKNGAFENLQEKLQNEIIMID